MNERHLAHKLVYLLDESTQRLDTDIAKRLHAARTQALSRQKLESPAYSLAGAGAYFRDQFSSLRRSGLSLLALVVIAVGAQCWGQSQRLAEIEEVDSALLSDDLPIDAYLDRGFDTWLKDASQQ